MKKTRNFSSIVFIVVIFIFSAYALYAVSTTVTQRGQKAKEIAENEKEIAILKKDINMLNKEIKNSSSPEFVEKVAREDFGMVKPREIIYIDKDKDKHSKDSNLQERNE